MAYIGNSPANVGNYQIVDDISSSFNGSTTSFALASGSITITPAKSGQLLVGVNGVMQEPDDTGTNGFKVSGSNIVFSSAPASGDTFWAVYQGQAVDVGTPSAGTVDTTQLADGAVTAAKIADGTVVAAELASNSVTNVKMADDAVGVAELSATGTASSSTFLRGDNSWTAVAGATGGGSDEVFYENDQTITTNYELTANKNAMSAGPLTINSSISVTVPSGATWVIV